jgi:hypothetical protein
MRLRITIIILVLLAIVATVLLIIAIPRGPKTVAEVNLTNNVTQQNKPEVIPSTINEQDRQDITDIGTLFLELLGRYDETSNFENVNAALQYTTASLRGELSTFADAQRASGASPEGSFLVVTVIDAFEVSVGSNQLELPEITAAVTATSTTEDSSGSKQQDYSGTLRFSKVGENWFVDEMEFEPDFLGFR